MLPPGRLPSAVPRNRTVALLAATETVRLITLAIEEVGQAWTGAAGCVAAVSSPSAPASPAATTRSQVVVAVAAAVALPGAAVRNERRVGALVASVAAYVPVTRVSPTGPDVVVDTVLVGALRLTVLRGLVRLVEAETAAVPPAVRLLDTAAEMVVPGAGVAGLLP